MHLGSFKNSSSVIVFEGKEKKKYRALVEERRTALQRDDIIGRVECDNRFMDFVSPFILERFKFSPSRAFAREKGGIEVACAPLMVSGRDANGTHYFISNGTAYEHHGFVLRPRIGFCLGRDLFVEEAYVEGPHVRTTLHLVKDVIQKLYPINGDGTYGPCIEVGEDKSDRLHRNWGFCMSVASADYLPGVVDRVRRVFGALTDQEIGAAVALHHAAAEEQAKVLSRPPNPTLVSILMKDYHSLLDQAIGRAGI